MQKALLITDPTFLVWYRMDTIRQKVAIVGLRLFVFLRYFDVPVIIFIRDYSPIICGMMILHLPSGKIVSSRSIIERFIPEPACITSGKMDGEIRKFGTIWLKNGGVPYGRTDSGR